MNGFTVGITDGLQLFQRSIFEQVSNINNFIAQSISVAAADSNIVLGIDMSIEGLRSQKYSVGIFVFLVISLIFFSAIIYMYMPRKGKPGLKKGEKVMFGFIIAGVFLAIAVGWIELIEGYLL